MFPRDESLDLTSSRESGCEESQEQLLGAGQPRLIADCSLLFLLCKLPRRVNILEKLRKRLGSWGSEGLGGRVEGVFFKSSGNVPAPRSTLNHQ